MVSGPNKQDEAIELVRSHLHSAEVEFEEAVNGTFAVSLPGTRRLKTVASLVVGQHTLTTNAFVLRHPDENLEGVYKWLLERNRRLNAVAYAIDAFGDVYLVGHLPIAAVTPESIDAILGAVLEYADGDFNSLLELGFASAITKEWRWRRSRGESTANLAAFAHLGGPDEPSDQVRAD